MTTLSIPPLSIELIEQANGIVQSAYAKIRQHYPDRSFELPTIVWKNHGSIAGMAYLNSNEIHLSPVLYALNPTKFQQTTIIHEAAHLISYKLYGSLGRGHGRLWRGVMRFLGVKDPTRCHTYDVSAVARKKSPTRRPYIYKCKCQNHQLTRLLHSKIVAGKFRRCKRCRGRLEFVEVNTKYNESQSEPTT